MSKFSWTIYIFMSMVTLGVNMIRHSHDAPELLQFTGGYLVCQRHRHSPCQAHRDKSCR